MRAKLQGAVVTVLEEGFAINAEEFFHALSGDPPWMLSHDKRVVYSCTLQHVKELSTDLRKFLSLYLSENKYRSN